MTHPTRTSHSRKRVPLAIGIVVAVALALLAIPTKVRCGAPGLACATAVDAHGNIHYYYEVEPLGVYIVETFTGSNIRLFYRSGEDLEKARSSRQSVGTAALAVATRPAAPAPDLGDQTTAEQRIVDGYVAKQRGCTPDLTPNPQGVTWDPPGFTPNVGGTGMVRDADPRLGGQFRADWVNGRWNIVYPYC
jgi:hypothetical protein